MATNFAAHQYSTFYYWYKSRKVLPANWGYAFMRAIQWISMRAIQLDIVVTWDCKIIWFNTDFANDLSRYMKPEDDTKDTFESHSSKGTCCWQYFEEIFARIWRQLVMSFFIIFVLSWISISWFKGYSTAKSLNLDSCFKLDLHKSIPQYHTRSLVIATHNILNMFLLFLSKWLNSLSLFFTVAKYQLIFCC